MKNTQRKKTQTLTGSLQLIVHFLLVIPLYWVFGQKQTHQDSLSAAELSYWAKTKFGKSNQELHQELLQEDPVAASNFSVAIAANEVK